MLFFAMLSQFLDTAGFASLILCTVEEWQHLHCLYYEVNAFL